MLVYSVFVTELGELSVLELRAVIVDHPPGYAELCDNVDADEVKDMRCFYILQCYCFGRFGEIIRCCEDILVAFRRWWVDCLHDVGALSFKRP